MKEAEERSIVCFSAGFATNLAMHLISMISKNLIMFDTGAIFDPFCGVWTRKVYRRPDWQQNELQKMIREIVQ